MGRAAEGQVGTTGEGDSVPGPPAGNSAAWRTSSGAQGRSGGLVAVLSLAAALPLAIGCVSPAEHRKLENRVHDLSRSQRGTGSSAQRAELTADLQSLRAEIEELRGRVDVAEREAREALAQSGRARRELAAVMGTLSTEGRFAVALDDSEPEDPGNPLKAESGSAELRAYRIAYSAWRGGDHGHCIDQFRKFLQTYPASAHADDAAFWMADCHYKEEDYRNAVLRFDDVVRNYPTGNKAPDALYRQGESLLKLGPGFHEAAKRAFDRVLKEYPGSSSAKQAAEQLEALRTH